MEKLFVKFKINKIFYEILLIFNLILISFEIFAVCIGVNCNCAVNVAAPVFGNYNPFLAPQIDVDGNIAVTCGADLVGAVVVYDIELSTGNSGNYGLRYMQNGLYHMNYNLYTNAARTNVWGDGNGGTTRVHNNYNLVLETSRLTNHPLYARLFGGQVNIGRGNYIDNIIVTVVY